MVNPEAKLAALEPTTRRVDALERQKAPRRRWIFLSIGAVGAIALAIVFIAFPPKGILERKAKADDKTVESEAPRTAELVPGRADTIRVKPDAVRGVNIRADAARPASQPRHLELSGTLAVDANVLARVHSRFAGELVRLGETTVARSDSRNETRPIRPGDTVAAGQLLGVVWSKDLGEKKSELVDALSQQRLNKETLARLEVAYASGAATEASLRQARRNVEADAIAVARTERTLRSWRLTEAEIEEVRAEAARLRAGDKKNEGKDRERTWAQVEVRAAAGGTVLERNVAVGDIVDTTTDLFKVADLTRLSVWANIYEEDLPALLALPAEHRRWSVRLKADPHATPLEGEVDHVGDILDPNQHTALVTGRVDNRNALLRAGQFVTATIDLPPSSHETLVPESAVIEDGREAFVFVQPDPARPEYVLRAVVVARRLPGAVSLRNRLRPDEEKRGLYALQPGERVVVSGTVLLKGAWDELREERSE